jgi:hypothetical protein
VESVMAFIRLERTECTEIPPILRDYNLGARGLLLPFPFARVESPIPSERIQPYSETDRFPTVTTLLTFTPGPITANTAVPLKLPSDSPGLLGEDGVN